MHASQMNYLCAMSVYGTLYVYGMELSTPYVCIYNHSRCQTMLNLTIPDAI